MTDQKSLINSPIFICTIGTALKYKKSQEKEIFFYKTIAVPTVVYGREIQTTAKKEESRIQVQEVMVLIRRAKSSIRLDRIRNREIRRNLNIFDIIEIIKISKIK